MVRKQKTLHFRQFVLLNEFNQINKKIVHFSKEISTYKPFICRCLSVYLICTMGVISLCTYILLMTKTAIQFKIMFSLVNFGHLISLSSVIYFSSRLPSNQYLMSNKCYKFLSKVTQKRHLYPRLLIKVSQSKLMNPFN